MRWSQFFIPTVRETPADAVVPSHVLMIRAGLIRQTAAGVYSYLPAGYRVLRKVEAIVREEMNAAGAVELHLPAISPLDWWEQTGRAAVYGDVLMRIAPGSRGQFGGLVLGPTHEEIITEIARAYLTSYKQLPVNFYQIQTKFRGEERPKSGVLRTREFLMKDAYSFHTDVESLERTYDKMYAAYCRIFTRCGLPYFAVEAESGPIGGGASHEFMVATDAGEDLVALTRSGGYAANIEKATRQPPAAVEGGQPLPLEEVATPGATTITEICELLGTKPPQMIKTLVYRTTAGETIVALVRGDHEVNESKLARAVEVDAVELADDATIEALTGAGVGFAGPHALKQPVRIVADLDVPHVVNGVTGACRTDYHVRNLNVGRDYQPTLVGDIRTVVAGDLAPDGSGEPLGFRKTVEVGHVFKLGDKYSRALHATYLDANGKSHHPLMGCYGIGLNRIMAAAIEAGHDAGGIVWPVSIAPFEVLIVALDPKDELVRSGAAAMHDGLVEAGIDVLLDDRELRPGVKFNDADLIGIPLRITIGRRGLADGTVELKPRTEGEVSKVPLDDAAAAAVEWVRQARAALSPT